MPIILPQAWFIALEVDVAQALLRWDNKIMPGSNVRRV